MNGKQGRKLPCSISEHYPNICGEKLRTTRRMKPEIDLLLI
jgi:hypothetical protein